MSANDSEKEWKARYAAGRAYTGEYIKSDDFWTHEVDVHVTCECGAEFDIHSADMPLQCVSCERIYRAGVVVEVSSGG